jgi:hypothetical protein
MRLRDGPWRRLDGLGTAWEDRVFIGGSFRGDYLPGLLDMRDIVRGEGLDGVLVADFRKPAWLDDETMSLMLLRDCGRAVFDVSGPVGGDLLEIHVARESSKPSLLLRSKNSPDLLRSFRQAEAAWFETREYESREEMKEAIERWLRSEARRGFSLG